MALRFSDQVAIVTGGADGLGKGITHRLLSEGATVVIFDVKDSLMQAAEAEFKGLGLERVSSARVDVASEAEVKAAIDAVATKHGRLDIMINCAGIVGAWCHS